MVVPSTITVNAFDRDLWKSWVTSGRVWSVLDFINLERLFPEVDSRKKFALITLGADASDGLRVKCWMRVARDVDDTSRPAASLMREHLAELSGASLALPHFTNQRDLDLLGRVIRQFGRLEEENLWEADYVLLGDTKDKGFLKVRRRCDKPDESEPRPESSEWAPLYEGKMVHVFDHRAASVIWNPANPKRKAQEVTHTDEEKSSVDFSASPLWEVPRDFLALRDPHMVRRGWDLCLCDVTSAMNERTALACVIPASFATHNLPLVRIGRGDPRASAVFLGCLGSFALDYLARLRVAGNHLTEEIFWGLPVPSFEHLATTAELVDGGMDWVIRHVLELSYSAWDLQPFAKSLGFEGPPFPWDQERRLRLKAELDSFFLLAYGFTPGESGYILDSFSVLKRREERRSGAFRTKEVTLRVLEEMASCRDKGDVWGR
jgi:hypothetical protein